MRALYVRCALAARHKPSTRIACVYVGRVLDCAFGVCCATVRVVCARVSIFYVS